MPGKFLLVACMVIAQLAFAAASDPPLLRIKSEILDSKLPLVKVGGEDTLGLMVNDPARHLDLNHLVALLPMHLKSELCTRLTSRNGEFKVALAYNVRNVPPGAYRLEFRSKYVKELDRFGPDDLAILLWLANSCQAKIPDEPELVLAASQANPDLRNVYVYQNAGRLSARFVDVNGKPVKSCISLPGASVSFDTKCGFPVSVGNAQALTLQLIHFGSVQDTISIRFKLP